MTNALDRLAARLERLEKRVSRTKLPQLANSSVEDGALRVNVNTPTEDGSVTSQTTMQIGQQYDGTAAAAVITGPIPPQPSAPVVEEVIGGLKVKVDGTFIDALVVPMDFSRWEIHVSEDPNFYPDLSTTLYATIESPRGGEHTMALPYRVHYVRIVCRTVPGKGSSPSDRAEGTPRYVQQLDIDPSVDMGGGGGPTAVPAASPATVVAPLGVSAVVASWAPAADVDAYDVYVSTSPITVFDTTTLLGSGSATSLSIGQLPDGTPVTPGTPVYVRVWAKNSIGRALAAGGEGSATPRAATTADIAADFVYAGRVSAVQVDSGNLTAALALLGSLTVGTTTGQRIVLNPAGGFQVISATGAALVNFPTSDGGKNTFQGDLVAEGFTALGRASFRGNDNEISRNSSFTLASGTTKPSNALTVSPRNDSRNDFPARWSGRRGAIFQEGNTLYMLEDENGGSYSGTANRRILSWDFTTGAGGAVTDVPLGGGMNTTYEQGASSLVKLGSNFFWLHWREGLFGDTPAWSSQGWYVEKFALDGTWVSRFKVQANIVTNAGYTGPQDTPNGEYPPALGTDGANLLLAYVVRGTNSTTAGPLRVTKLNPSTGAVVSSVTGTQTYGQYDYPDRIMVGSYDRGAPRYLVSFHNTDGTGTSPSTVRGLDPANLAELEVDDLSGPGLWWDAADGRFHAVTWDWSDGTYHLVYSKNKDLTPIWVGYSWYDSDPGGTGTHETTLSPLVKYTPQNRYEGWTYSLPVPPADAGDSDSPDSARVYAVRSASTTPPAENTMHRVDFQQAPVVYGSTTIYVSYNLDWTFTATAPPTVNSFPDGFAGLLKSGIGGFVVRGDGTGAWPYLIDPINSSLTDKNSRLNVLEGKNLDSRLTTIESKNLDSRLTTAELDIDSLTSAGAGVETRLTAAETKNTTQDNRLTIIEAVPVWHTVGNTGEPAFQNGWTAVAGYDIQFAKLASGLVVMRGQAQSGTDVTTAFILPQSCWPVGGPAAITFVNSANGGSGWCKVDVFRDTGAVRIQKLGTTNQSLQATWPAF